MLRYFNEDIEHKSTIVLSDEVMDNSDIPERFVSGNFTRLSLNISIPDAYLWDVRLKDTSNIEGVSIVAESLQEEMQEEKLDEQLDGKGVIIREI